MGKKGSKLTPEATATCEQMVQALSEIGDVSSRKMFGGYGIFESGVMFALVNSHGDPFLKADETNRSRFEKVKAKQHGKMPYFQVPPAVLKDKKVLTEWARASIEVAHANKKK